MTNSMQRLATKAARVCVTTGVVAALSLSIFPASVALASQPANSVATPNMKAALADKADIQDLQVTFTDQTGTLTLENGDDVPRRANGTNYAVGAKISFSLDTSGYQAGDQISIGRSVAYNGQESTTGLSGINSFAVVDPDSGLTLGTFSEATGGNIIFTLSQSALDAGTISISALITNVFSPSAFFLDRDYQLTVGNSTIDLIMPGSGFLKVNPNSNSSADGTSQWISSATSNNISYGFHNDYSGHVAQQGTPTRYTDATGGILTNVSDNAITKVVVGGNYRSVSFWSDGVLYTVPPQSIGEGIAATGFLGGVNNSVYKNASGKLTPSMSVQDAQDALSPGEWGSVKLPDGSWLWAYKTGDPSEGTTFDAEGFIAALQAAGVTMTDEDIAKTLAQNEFIANTHSYLSVTFADSTINGTVVNTMATGSQTGSTVLPTSSSSVPGRIMVSYIDDTTGTLLTAETDKGTAGSASTYSTAAKITAYEIAGYTLVSDDYSTSPMPVVFGGLGSLAQYQVHLAHGTLVSTEIMRISQTIHYVYPDGSQAALDVRDTVTFTRNLTTDLVTGATTYAEWVAYGDDTTFDAVASPVIDGYTPDQETVAEVTGLTSNSTNSSVTVTYTKVEADKPAEDSDIPQTPMNPAGDPGAPQVPVTPSTPANLAETGIDVTGIMAVASILAFFGAVVLGVLVYLRRTSRKR